MAAILEICKLCQFQPLGTMHPIKTSRNEFSTLKLVELDMLIGFISFLVQKLLMSPSSLAAILEICKYNISLHIWHIYNIHNMHITSTYLYHRWWVNFPWGGSIFYYRKVTRGSVFYGGQYSIWHRSSVHGWWKSGRTSEKYGRTYKTSLCNHV